MDHLGTIISTLHERGLNEAEILHELQSKNLISHYETENVIQTIKYVTTGKKHPFSWGNCFIRIWGIICLLIGLLSLITIAVVIMNGGSIRRLQIIITIILIPAGIILLLRPSSAFNHYDN